MPPSDRSRPDSGFSSDQIADDDDTANVPPATRGMTKADRANLERLARKRAKVATSMIGERVKVLRADVEDQLSAEYKFDDAIWVDITRHAKAEVAKADAQIAAICRQLGVPDHLRPSIGVSWSGRGENWLASRRVELRKLAYARIDAAAESAKVAIQAEVLKVETELIRDGLETAEALRFVDSMPTAEDLLPPVAVDELEPGSPQRSSKYGDDEYVGRYGGWHPPQDAAGTLLSPSSASNREEKHQQIARALAANPDASNREIARMVGVDHKTVAAVRPQAGEIPTSGDGSGEAGGA